MSKAACTGAVAALLWQRARQGDGAPHFMLAASAFVMGTGASWHSPVTSARLTSSICHVHVGAYALLLLATFLTSIRASLLGFCKRHARCSRRFW